METSIRLHNWKCQYITIREYKYHPKKDIPNMEGKGTNSPSNINANIGNGNNDVPTNILKKIKIQLQHGHWRDL